VSPAKRLTVHVTIDESLTYKAISYAFTIQVLRTKNHRHTAPIQDGDDVPLLGLWRTEADKLLRGVA